MVGNVKITKNLVKFTAPCCHGEGLFICHALRDELRFSPDHSAMVVSNSLKIVRNSGLFF